MPTVEEGSSHSPATSRRHRDAAATQRGACGRAHQLVSIADDRVQARLGRRASSQRDHRIRATISDAVSAKTAGVWTCALRDLAGFFSRIDGAEVMLRGNAVIGITGGPTADFNMALFGDDPDEVQVFDEFLSRVKAKGVSAVALMSGVASRRLGSVAKAKGLTEAGSAPLMVRSGTLRERPSSEFVTKRINDPGEMSVFGELAAAAFAMDRPWVDRTFAATSLLTAPGLAFYIARRGNLPMSGVCTTSAGSMCGVWTMSTPPEQQRQGAGRAVLLAAMQDELNRGVDTFYLIATAQGKPLYDKIGFETVEQLSIWLAGASSQFSGH